MQVIKGSVYLPSLGDAKSWKLSPRERHICRSNRGVCNSNLSAERGESAGAIY